MNLYMLIVAVKGKFVINHFFFSASGRHGGVENRLSLVCAIWSYENVVCVNIYNTFTVGIVLKLLTTMSGVL